MSREYAHAAARVGAVAKPAGKRSAWAAALAARAATRAARKVTLECDISGKSKVRAEEGLWCEWKGKCDGPVTVSARGNH